MGLIGNMMTAVGRISKNRIQKRRAGYWKEHFSMNTRAQVLSDDQKDEIKAYFKDYKDVSMVFHNFYTEKTGHYYVNYIPDDLYYCVIDPYFNDWEKASILDNKCFYSSMFKGINHAENILYRANNLWFSEGKGPLKQKDIYDILSRFDSFFLKEATESEGGIGVSYIDGDDRVERLLDKASKISGDIVIQKALTQHKALSDINSSSVNTIRVLSLLTNEGVKVYSSILRMGIKGAKVDNASSGGITCGIDANGKLREFAYTTKGERFSAHPDSGVVFSGYDIPSFSSVIDLVSKLHPQIPHFRPVSWDIAIDENGTPTLIEANLKYGELDFHQLNNGPVFGDDTYKILNEVFGR